MKKTYINPQVDVVEVKINNSLLAVSTPTESTANVSIGGSYDPSDDID